MHHSLTCTVPALICDWPLSYDPSQGTGWLKSTKMVLSATAEVICDLPHAFHDVHFRQWVTAGRYSEG